MKNPAEVLQQIKNGQPYSYPAGITKGRTFTITVSPNSQKHFALSANNLKSKEPLTESQALEIITNTLSH